MSDYNESSRLDIKPLILAPVALNPVYVPIDPKALGCIIAIFLLLLQAMEIRQGTAVAQSKQLIMNASAQNHINSLLAQLHFTVLPPNATKNDINRVEEINEEISAVRQNFQQQEMTMRQEGNILVTQTSTNVDILEQDADENSGWIKMVSTIFQVINEIAQASR